MTLLTTYKDLYIAPENAYAQSPRPADADFVAVPTTGNVLTFADTRAILDTSRNVGRPGMSRKVPGPGGGTISFQTSVHGLATQGATGAPPPPEDWLDFLFGGVGIAASRDGIDVTTAAADGSTLFSANIHSTGDLVPVEDGGALQFNRIVDGSLPTKVFARPWAPLLNQLSARALPFRQYTDANGLDTTHTLHAAFRRTNPPSPINNGGPGGRINSLAINATGSALATMAWGIAVDEKTSESFAFTPAVNGTPTDAETPSMRLADVFIDGVRVPTAQVGVTWTFVTGARTDTGLPNNRNNHVLISADPAITIQPAYVEAYEDESRTLPDREILVVYEQPGTLERLACLFPICQLSAPPTETDNSGILDATLNYSVATVTDASGPIPRWIVVRC